MPFCPNKNSPEFINLVDKVGEHEAYALWDRYEGNVPSSQEDDVKPGVAELFDSNPELANAVYEALGVKPANISFNIEPFGKSIDNIDIIKDGKKIGYVQISKNSTSKTITVTGIELKEKGVGKNIYLKLQQQYPNFTIKSDKTALTPDAINMWDSLVSKKLATKEGDKEYTLNTQQALQQYFTSSVKNSSENTSNNLDSVIKDILSEIGVNVKKVYTLTDKEGKPMDGVAKASLLKKIVEVVEGKSDISTLPEEAAHFFIEMLDPKSHVFKAMYDKIETYPIYAKVVEEYGDKYDHVSDLLKKEAMAKLVAQEIINAHENTNANLNTPAQIDRTAKWWNLAWAYIKRQFTKLDTNKLNKAIEEYNPFKEVAENILDKNLDFFPSTITNEHDFLQISRATTTLEQTEIQKDTVKVILDSAKNIVVKEIKGERAYYKGDKKLGPSVTTVRDAKYGKRFKNKPLTPEQLAKRNFSGEIGNKVHDDIQNIANRILRKDTGTTKVIHSDPVTYAKLENYITKFKGTFPEGTVFLVEQIVYNEATNTPGTIDLLAIEPDGKTHIYDWKTMGLSKLEKEEYGEPSRYKTEKYDFQIGLYKQNLHQYGVRSFGHLRYVPMEVVLKKNKETGKLVFSELKVGDPTFTSTKTPSYLNPIPVAEETSGIEPLDELVSQLKALHKEISIKKIVSEIEKTKRAQRLASLRQAILQLQVRKSFKGYIENSIIEFSTINALLKSNEKTPISEKDLVDMHEHLKLYTGISKKLAALDLSDKIIKKLSLEDKLKLNAVQSEAEKHVYKVEQLLKEKFIKAAKSAGITDFSISKLNEYKPVGTMARMFTSLSRIDHPIFRTLWTLINKANIETRKETEKLGTDIQAEMDKYHTWAKGRGLSGTDMYKYLIDKKAGKMISKYSADYYKTKKEKADKGDWQWIKANSVVDEVKLKEYIKTNAEFIKNHTWSSDEAYNKAIIKTKTEELHANFDIFNHNSAWLNLNSYFTRFVKPADKWHSNEYKFLLANKPALDFYNFFTSKIREFSEFMPLSKGDGFVNPDRFIPNIEKDLIENVMNNGGSISVKGLGNSFIDMFEYKQNEDPTFGQINEFTGALEHSVPVYYTSEIDTDKKSYDLGRVLLLFGKMAYNYKNMDTIEGTVKNLQGALQNSKEAVTDGSGKILMNKMTTSVVKKLVSTDTLSSFNDFVNYYVYGVKQKDNWGFIEKQEKVIDPITGEETVITKKYSKNKMAQTTLKTWSAKALGFNFVSIVANGFGGFANTFIAAAGGEFFTYGQWSKSIGLITAGNLNPETRMLMKFLNMTGERELSKISNEVSVNNLIRKPGFDDFFIFQSKTDNAIYNVAALSMLQNFGVDAAGKIKRLDKLPKDTKSIYSQIKIKNDGTLNLTDLISDEEFQKFRTSAQALGEKMIGMSTRDNVNGVRMTMIGQAFMQFRGWIPRMAGARFGNIRFDPELDVVERGRYLSMINQLWNKRAVFLIGELLAGYTVGSFGNNTKEMVKEMYNKHLIENPHLDREEFTFEKFYDAHVANVKATTTELILILSFYALLTSLKEGLPDDDDPETKRAKHIFTKTVNRAISELTFFLSPEAMSSITKGALPILGFFTDIINTFGYIFGEAGHIFTGDERDKNARSPGWVFARLFPGGRTLEMFFSEDKNKK